MLGQNSSRGGGGVRVQVRGSFHILTRQKKKKKSEGGGLNPLPPPPSGSATVHTYMHTHIRTHTRRRTHTCRHRALYTHTCIHTTNIFMERRHRKMSKNIPLHIPFMKSFLCKQGDMYFAEANCCNWLPIDIKLLRAFLWVKYIL